MHMIILLQSVAVQFRRLFKDISYYKVRQSNFVRKCDRLLLQSASGITKCERLLLQSASGNTKCDSYYKVRSNNSPLDQKWYALALASLLIYIIFLEPLFYNNAVQKAFEICMISSKVSSLLFTNLIQRYLIS